VNCIDVNGVTVVGTPVKTAVPLLVVRVIPVASNCGLVIVMGRFPDDVATRVGFAL
jgi:hypothetical protein